MSRPLPTRGLAIVVRAAAVGGLCLCAGLPAPAQEPGELDALKERIVRGRAALDKVRAGEASVLEVLDELDAALERRTRRLGTLDADLERRARAVDASARAADEAAAALAQGRRALAGRLRALYRWRRSGTPFVLFNGELSASALMRRKRLLETVLGHDGEMIRRLDGDLRRSRELRATLEARRGALARERDEAARLRDELAEERERRRAALAALRRERELRVRALQELQQAACRLEGVIRGSDRRRILDPAAAPAVPGGLELPVAGRVASGFGIHRHPDLDVDVHRPGIDIVAPAGAEVRAVARGRVLFADRLPGYGKMLILDHGGRYYTVYGHLAALARSAGDRVERGEGIARVGDDSASGQARLYFEVRRNGKPVDPLPWFRGAQAPAGGEDPPVETHDRRRSKETIR